ncbi:MAG: hypothetical protein ACO3JL_14570 [Myxococcota bacterium]
MDAEEGRLEALRALAARKPTPLHLYGLGMELRNCGRAEEAIDVFADLHQRFRNYVPAYFMRAQALEELERYQEARDALAAGLLVAEQEGDEHAVLEMRSMLDTLPGDDP